MRDDVTAFLARVVRASMTRQTGGWGVGGYSLQAVALFGPRDILLAGAVYDAEEQLLLLAGDTFFILISFFSFSISLFCICVCVVWSCVCM